MFTRRISTVSFCAFDINASLLSLSKQQGLCDNGLTFPEHLGQVW